MSRRLAAGLCFVLAACGSGNGPDERTRPLTADEAGRLAETLFHNTELGGADVTLTALMPSGVEIRLNGHVDWADHLGHATVSIVSGPEASITEVYWGETFVLERNPTLDALAERAARTGLGPWWARPPDPDHRDLDGMIALVAGLGAAQRDNAVLIQQAPGSQWMRADERNGVAVDVMRYGERSTYWIEAGGITLMRFEGNNAAGTRPVVVDLSDHGPRSVALPDGADVSDALSEPDLYAAATGGLSPVPTPATGS